MNNKKNVLLYSASLAWKDLYERLPLYVGISFIIFLGISFILAQNSVFVASLEASLNGIYAGIVQAGAEGSSYVLSESVNTIALSFLKWFIELFVILVLMLSLVFFGVSSKVQKMSLKNFGIVVLISVFIAILFTLIMNVFSLFYVFVYSLWVYSLIVLGRIVKSDLRDFAHRLASISRVVFGWTFVYFFLVVVHFATSVYLLRASGNQIDGIGSFFLGLFLAIVYLFCFHGVINSSSIVYSSKRWKHGFFETLKKAFFCGNCYILTAVLIVGIFLLDLIFRVIAMIPFMGSMSGLLMMIVFVVLIAYYLKFVFIVNAKLEKR